MSDETSNPTPDDDRPADARALAAAMATPGLRHPEPSPAASLAALMALPEPGTTIH